MLAVLAAIAVLPTDSAAPLKPTTKWSIDYAEDQCFLSRKYGDGTEGLTLGLGMRPVMRSAELFLIEPARGEEGGRLVSGAIELGGSKDLTAAKVLSATTKDGSRITRFWASAALIDRIRTSDEVTISIEKRRYRLHLDSMPAAFAAADACKADLMKSWGLDPTLMTDVHVPAEPIGSPGDWVSPNEYPIEARRKREMGKVTVRLDIDLAGKVTGCAVVRSSGSESLDRVTCDRAGSRGKFRPAQNSAGKAIPTIRILEYTWSLTD